MTPSIEQPKMRNATLIASKAQDLLGTVKVESVGSVPIATSPASPVVLAPVKSLPEQTVEETTTEQPVLQSLPTIKLTKDASNMDQTKSGDTWLNIQFPNLNNPAPSTPGSTLTEEQKNQRALIIGSVLLTVIVLVVWVLNRKKTA